MNKTENPGFNRFLCDTWWYGLTQRFDQKTFQELATLRSKQGFNAIQMVIGIPPEVGPKNPNAASEVGPAWNLEGQFNEDYLKYSRDRVTFLNTLGITAILYGAWGQQIEWLGEKRMIAWWSEIIKRFDDLNVMYCLTGESDLMIGQEKKLLPDLSTAELNAVRITPYLHPKITYYGKRLLDKMNQPFDESKKAKRHQKWSKVLKQVSSLTDKPIMIHVVPNMTSEEAVNNPQLLDAITVQTGHSIDTRPLLWQLPFESTQSHPNKPFINLEPWYEGIKDNFGTEDQLYAYWASMMAGSFAYCYGAHGVWNAGDGNFLNHWGNQTLQQAIKLNTPELIGQSHQFFLASGCADYPLVDYQSKGDQLLSITRSDKQGNFVTFVPDIQMIDHPLKGTIYSPTKGKTLKSIPQSGQVVFASH